MRSVERQHLLPLWDSTADSSTPAAKSEDSTTSTKTMMILVSVPESLESPLRAVVRDEDGVDAELRAIISNHLPRVKAVTGGPEEAEPQPPRAAILLPPSALARALPHIRRVMPRPAAGEAGALGLLKGGAIVFQEAGGVSVAEESAKEGEERRLFEERRNRLILLRESREYARMTSNIQRPPRETVHDIQATFKFQAGMGANMVLAVVSSFIVSYWASKFVVGKNTSHRMVIGLVGAVFMLLVELLVFVTRSLKADEVLEAARQAAEDSHTDVGVHRLAPRVGGRGELDGGGSEAKGDYELVSRGISGAGADEPPQEKAGIGVRGIGSSISEG